MPELPEVEVVRRGLATHLTGRTIADVDVLHPRPVRRHLAGAEDFAARLRGLTVAEPRRRGKYLWWPLSNDDALIAHLGMSGQFRVDGAGAPDQRHLRVRFRFDDGGPEVRFIDQRMFGGLAISVDGAELPGEISHIGPDPFEAAYDQAAIIRRLRTRRSGIKRALLDQTLVSGIGNIYADEALWRARVHPETPTNTMSPARIRRVLDAAFEVMNEALAQGGTSFDALYVNINGESGYFARSLDAYGRVDQACRRCGRPIVREQFMNRSSFRCPTCQPRPRVGTRLAES
ncbi:bifunctional DNA-formamidopyrimidine glycosylase/DNA-(apurinic or apyrimidinic site) lyase [Enemella sp. A6]|uniref:bifunctional DNA-formamidopyrimidine glycosylase/DNA-(apurinic or apyrimidinic site) lyase n=1 Tax=Enemella sp. A6 TaxID=3440152 RepID=UPI003EB71F6E